MNPLMMGEYIARLECPDCGAGTAVSVALSTVLTASTDEPSSLKLRAKSGKVEHRCGISGEQLRLEAELET